MKQPSCRAAAVLLALVVSAGCDVGKSPLAPVAPQPPAPERHVVAARYMLRRPVIDGRLDDLAWADVPLLEMDLPFGLLKPTSDSCSVRIGWNYSAVFFAFRTDDADIVSVKRPHDGPCWEDDCIEVFIDPTGRAGSYWEIGLNASGSLYDYFIVRRDGPGEKARFLDVSIEGLKYAVQAEPGRGWSAEIEVPFRGLFMADNFPPLPGDLYRLSLGFGDNDPGSYTGKSCIPVRSHHDPESYGYLSFDGTALASQLHNEQLAASEFLRSEKPPPDMLLSDLSSLVLQSRGSPFILKKELVDSQGKRLRRHADPSSARENQYYGPRWGRGRVELVEPGKSIDMDEPHGPGPYLRVQPSDIDGTGPSTLEIKYLPTEIEAPVSAVDSIQLWYRTDPARAESIRSASTDGAGIALWALDAAGSPTLVLERYCRHLEWALASAALPAGTVRLRLVIDGGPLTPSGDLCDIRLTGTASTARRDLP
ncbi:MAG: carbohydrate-binding family 9-like protein [Planctomycetes bacterium]|nr:carbohydrate-binding family 9-like protein [Planctomycetota bacterium]